MKIDANTLVALARLCDYSDSDQSCDGTCHGCKRRELLVDHALVGISIRQLARREGTCRTAIQQKIEKAGRDMFRAGWRPEAQMSYPEAA